MAITINVVLTFSSCVLFVGSTAQNRENSVCETGPEVIQRNSVDQGNEFGAVMPNQTWDCDGPVAEWQYFAFNTRHVKFAAFMKPSGHKPENNDTDWQVVGFNDVLVSGGQGSYVVPEDERFMVKAGDAIGYAGSDIRYTHDGDIAHINSFSNMGSTLTVGEIYEMRWPHPEPRTYSIKGIVEKPQMSYDWAEDTVKEGRQLHVALTNVGRYSHTIRVQTIDGDAKAGINYDKFTKTYTLDGSETVAFQVQTIDDGICSSEIRTFSLLIFWDTTQIDWTQNYQMNVTLISDLQCAYKGLSVSSILLCICFAVIVVFVVVVIAFRIFTGINLCSRILGVTKMDARDREELVPCNVQTTQSSGEFSGSFGRRGSDQTML